MAVGVDEQRHGGKLYAALAAGNPSPRKNQPRGGRGQKAGTRREGEWLIEHVAARARKLGYPCVILAVNKRNTKAIGSYEKYGFVVRETIVDDIGHGFVMDDYVMEKKL